MDEDDEPMQKGGSRAPENTGPVMGPIYAMWESSVERLKILNYENELLRPKNKNSFSRIHFVVPGKNLSHQFEDFLDLCAWLCGVITKNPDFLKRDDGDDPTTAVNKLLLSLRQLDFRSSFSAQKLKTPHGEPVCTVLDFLTAKALESRGFKFLIPSYLDSEEAVQAEVDDDPDENELLEEAGLEAEEELLFEDMNVANDIPETSLDDSSHNILLGNIDPVEWKAELERVGPRLKQEQQLSTNEWRAHVDQTVVSKGQIDQVLGETQNDLQITNRNVSEETKRMSQKEKYLNLQFTSISSEYQEIKQVMQELESKSSKTNEKVAKYTVELAELTEKLEEMKESFESKDSGMNDTSPLVRVKAALKQIKDEIRSFDMRIGVVSHSLLSARIIKANRHRTHTAKKAKNRHSKGRGKREIIDDDDENDSIMSGDD